MSTSPGDERSEKLMRANTKRPATKIRQEAIVSQREVQAREGFRFPPNTPKAIKALEWRVGSGFDGITIDQSTNRVPQPLRGWKVRRARTPCLLGRSPPKLQLSARLSPTHEAIGQRSLPEKQKQQDSPSETRNYGPAMELGSSECSVELGLPQRVANTGKEATYEQAASLDTPISPLEKNDSFRTASTSHVDTIAKKIIQQHLSQGRAFNASQAIRGPSKSERNGWLKRSRVGFTIAEENAEDPLFVHTERNPVNNVKDNWRYGLFTYFEDNEQNQNTCDSDLQGFVGDGQTASDLGQLLPTQQQDVFQTRHSAERHRRRELHDAKEKGSGSEEEITRRQSSNSPPEPQPCSEFEADFSTSPLCARGLSTLKASQHIQVPRTSEVPETQERLQEPVGQDR